MVELNSILQTIIMDGALMELYRTYNHVILSAQTVTNITSNMATALLKYFKFASVSRACLPATLQQIINVIIIFLSLYRIWSLPLLLSAHLPSFLSILWCESGLGGNSNTKCICYGSRSLRLCHASMHTFMYTVDNRVQIEQEEKGCFCLETPEGNKACVPSDCDSKWQLISLQN